MKHALLAFSLLQDTLLEGFLPIPKIEWVFPQYCLSVSEHSTRFRYFVSIIQYLNHAWGILRFRDWALNPTDRMDQFHNILLPAGCQVFREQAVQKRESPVNFSKESAPHYWITPKLKDEKRKSCQHGLSPAIRQPIQLLSWRFLCAVLLFTHSCTLPLLILLERPPFCLLLRQGHGPVFN